MGVSNKALLFSLDQMAKASIKHSGSQFWDSLWSPSVVEAQMCQQKNTSSREHQEHLQSVWLDSNPGSNCIDTLLHFVLQPLHNMFE